MLSRPEPTCAEVRRELTAFALREMSAADAVLVRRHVAGCSACARDGVEVLRLVGGLKSAAGPRQPAWGLKAACAAAIVGILFVVARTPLSGTRELASPGVTRAPAVAGLLAAQSQDGAWREDPRDASSLFTVGLSGLATVGCLRAGSEDAAAAEAARRGCDFLVAALASTDASPVAVSPDLVLRAQAAASWALGMAALRWPERYRDDAIVAIHRLGRLRDGWAPASGDVTATLVATAFRTASAIGVIDPDRGAASRPAFVPAGATERSAPVTRLAEQALASASPF